MAKLFPIRLLGEMAKAEAEQMVEKKGTRKKLRPGGHATKSKGVEALSNGMERGAKSTGPKIEKQS